MCVFHVTYNLFLLCTVFEIMSDFAAKVLVKLCYLTKKLNVNAWHLSVTASLFERHFTINSLMCTCCSLRLLSRRSKDESSFDLSHSTNVSITLDGDIHTK